MMGLDNMSHLAHAVEDLFYIIRDDPDVKYDKPGLYELLFASSDNLKNELENIQNHIYNIRGQRVMLDFDLAHIYEVETKALNQAVKRNYKRFEGDEFMFQLTPEEWKIFTNLNPQDSNNGDVLCSFSEDYNLRSQFVTSRFSNK